MRTKPRFQGKRKALRGKTRALEVAFRLRLFHLKHQSDLLRTGVYSPLKPEKAFPLSPTRGAQSFTFCDING